MTFRKKTHRGKRKQNQIKIGIQVKWFIHYFIMSFESCFIELRQCFEWIFNWEATMRIVVNVLVKNDLPWSWKSCFPVFEWSRKKKELIHSWFLCKFSSFTTRKKVHGWRRCGRVICVTFWTFWCFIGERRLYNRHKRDVGWLKCCWDTDFISKYKKKCFANFFPSILFCENDNF